MEHLETEAWQSRLSIVIPAFNEEGGIGKTLAALLENLPESEIIAVDDASRDATAIVARGFPTVRVLSHAFNRGYGAALKTGMRAATRAYVAWFDADNEHRIEDLKAMVQELESRKLCAVIGQRESPGVSVRIAGKWLIRMLASALKFNAGKDLNCGLRVFRREIILPYLPLLPNRYSASLTSTMLLMERGFPVAFHPIKLNSRIGTSKVRMADGFSTMLRVLQNIMVFAPLRIFFRLGAILILTGVVYSTIIALQVRAGLPAAGVLVVLAGFLFQVLGLIADQLSQMRLSQLEESHPFGVIEHGLVSGAPDGEIPPCHREK